MRSSSSQTLLPRFHTIELPEIATARWDAMPSLMEQLDYRLDVIRQAREIATGPLRITTPTGRELYRDAP